MLIGRCEEASQWKVSLRQTLFSLAFMRCCIISVRRRYFPFSTMNIPCLLYFSSQLPSNENNFTVVCIDQQWKKGRRNYIFYCTLRWNILLGLTALVGDCNFSNCGRRLCSESLVALKFSSVSQISQCQPSMREPITPIEAGSGSWFMQPEERQSNPK